MTPALPARPVDPGPSRFSFARVVADAGEEDLIAAGADLAPATLLAAYRAGAFPMGLDGLDDVMAWWSPAERGILDPARLHTSRSLVRSAKAMRFSVDADFEGVVAGCADPARSGAWITPEIAEAYADLHRLGWAHSIEVWAGDRLAGGLYGVAIGGLFAGESMFHRATDASKVALMALVEVIRSAPGPALIDVQWRTDHLASLGITTLDRSAYLARLPALTSAPGPDWAAWRGRRHRVGG
ncbi:leucyl/phenylalanyl-tRNA--protein transferase [Nostocoides veronense]|uniref:Leucyl/phenylalanyl-tRNA--protein transferase n=1 Tax=Nostocoides veronense TaxID=330836 RepID=A0ABN2LC02_9MICO